MLLKKIMSAMRGGEQVKMTARRMPDGNCEVLISAIFAEPPNDLSPALLQLRAALCKPIIIRATEDDLDADLHSALDAHANARSEATTMLLDGIAEIEAATNAAKGGSKGKKKEVPAKAAAKPAAAGKGAESEEEEEAGMTDAPATAPTEPGAVDLFAEAQS